MITAADIQMVRNFDPGAVLPGIDTMTGNPYATSTLLDVTKLTHNSSAPYFYTPSNNTVTVTQAGAVLSGINFGTATVDIGANNVTIEDCTFTGTTGYYAVLQTGTSSGATVENCTFTGTKSPTEGNVWIGSTQGSMTIEDNSFLNSPTDAIDMHSGVVTGNYFSGAGYLPGAHADAIWVTEFDRDHHHGQFHRWDNERRLTSRTEQRSSAYKRIGQSQQCDRFRQLLARRQLHRRSRKHEHHLHN